MREPSRGLPVADPGATSYRPVVRPFAMTALLAMAASAAAFGDPSPPSPSRGCGGFSMITSRCATQDVDRFATKGGLKRLRGGSFKLPLGVAPLVATLAGSRGGLDARDTGAM